MTGGFLAGTRVLDLSQYVPGPYAAQVLADLGAEVVKVEPPAGDPMRRLGPLDSDGLTAAYKLLNAGKTVTVLDLKQPADAGNFARLAARADVLVESYRPGTLDRLGFGRDRLAALNPGLVHVALSGWGQDGPYRLRAGHDITYMAIGGGLAASGSDRTPVPAYPPVADFSTAVQAALAAVAALFGRGRTGRGAFLDLSLMETVLGWQAMSLTAARRGRAPERGGDLLTGGAACYQVYAAAKGGFVALGAIEAKFWAAFCTALGRPDWIARQDEPMPQTGLIAEVAAAIAARSLDHWRGIAAATDCCLEIVEPLDAVPDHPQIAARGQVVAAGSGTEGLVQTLLGLRIDGAPPPARPPLAEAPAETIIGRWA